MNAARLKDIMKGWPALIALSLVLEVIWDSVGLPASAMMGPMLAAIVLSLKGVKLAVPPRAFLFSQGLVGIMMAERVPITVFDRLGASWPLFLGGTVWAMAAALFIGVILSRRKVLPGTTAMWGVSPGAAMAMVVMSEDYGADMRMVAFMQYLRVILVSIGAALVSGIAGIGPGGKAAAVWFPAIHWPSFAVTLAFTGGAVYLGKLLRLPGRAILAPFIGGLLLSQTGYLRLDLPPWLLVAAYALIGASIGLRFTREVLKNVAQALGKIVAAILSLMALCALFAALLVWAGDLDPLTAYLATSPGGVETVAIIAASAGADVAFVMAMQTFRMLLVLFTAPPLTRLVTQKLLKRER
ncbi:MAG: AbrB family transcriptional regulator [Candidatus Adiutrix sp.]|jgi:membrane AbrB-like protein|nr:AbrB family transcriptional regulator [Candidatus Adiutrix sp.]